MKQSNLIEKKEYNQIHEALLKAFTITVSPEFINCYDESQQLPEFPLNQLSNEVVEAILKLRGSDFLIW